MVRRSRVRQEVGADGAYFRVVHHFARQLASPFPLLTAVCAKTSRIEIGTAVIDTQYENPLYVAEDAGAADLISGGRLQLGISLGLPEQAQPRLAVDRPEAPFRVLNSDANDGAGACNAAILLTAST